MKTEEKAFMVSFVKNAISEFVENSKVIEIPKKYPERLNEKRGVFVTLHENGELRGCIGFCSTRRKIIENLRDAAIESCLDSRFSPVSSSELPCLDFEISVLTDPEPVKAERPDGLLEKIEPKKDGIIIECNGNSGLFLPQVWEDVPEKKEFLCHLCLKAGLPAGAWRSGALLYKFEAEIIKGRLK